MTSAQQDSAAAITWLLSFLRPYRWHVVGAVTALLIGALAWLLLGQGVRVAVDDGLVSGDTQRLNQLTLGVIAIACVASIATYFRFSLMTWLGERVSADIRQAVYHHLLSLPPTFFAETRTGEVISRFTADTTVLQTVIGMSISMALRASLTFMGALCLMLISSPKLTLYVLLAVPLVLLPIKRLGKKIRQYAQLSQDKVADIGAYIDETLHEIQTVQAYGHEPRDREAFATRVEAVMATAKQRIHYRSLLIVSIMIISLVAIISVAWLGAVEVIAGEISAGELTAFMFYAVLAGGSVATISEVIGEVQKAIGASARLRELLAERTHLSSRVDVPAMPSEAPPHQAQSLSFVNVSFAYPSALQQPVLKGINLHIHAGERVALVGPSGAGKSTLYQLLLGFYEVTQGQIRLGEHPLSTLPLAQVRQQFAIVPQTPVIFATTVIENIRYARPSATLEEVVAAAKTAQAHTFIEQLSEGYNSNLGERGVKLSGGQKQRISIARAILADRPCLLLDEATSALDAVNEQMVQEGLNHLMQGKTTLIIAHRLATVMNADRILVMQAGRIVAEGTHAQLMTTSPLYREHAELQLLPNA